MPSAILWMIHALKIERNIHTHERMAALSQLSHILSPAWFYLSAIYKHNEGHNHANRHFIVFDDGTETKIKTMNVESTTYAEMHSTREINSFGWKYSIGVRSVACVCVFSVSISTAWYLTYENSNHRIFISPCKYFCLFCICTGRFSHRVNKTSDCSNRRIRKIALAISHHSSHSSVNYILKI